MSPDAVSYCSLCGLPYRSAESSSSGDDGYCCYGCSLVDSLTRGRGGDGHGGDGGDPAERAAQWILARIFLGVFFAMGVMVFSLALYADVSYGDGVDGHALGPLAPAFGWLAMIFATPAVLLLGGPLLIQTMGITLRGRPLLRALTPNPVAALIGIGSLSAYVLSVVHLVSGRGEVYFDTAVMILLLLTAGRFLEARARARFAGERRKLEAFSPGPARRVAPDGTTAPIAIESLRRGDHVAVVAGETFPVDGRVVEGRVSVDPSLVTGESRSEDCRPGAKVFAGTVCLDGSCVVEATELAGERLVDRIRGLVAAAHLGPRMERSTARWSRRVLVGTLLAAAATFGYWLIASDWISAQENALAVLLIACPCAVGVAAPLSVHVALVRAARRGILVRDGSCLEDLGRARTVLFDKTGTLTERELEVSSIHAFAGERDEVVRVASSLGRESTHPASRAAARTGARVEANAPRLRGVGAVAGRGIAAELDGEPATLGSLEFVSARHGRGTAGGSFAQRLRDFEGSLDPGESAVFVARGEELAGAIRLRESLRPEASPVVRELEGAGLEVRVITGDRVERGREVAGRLGVRASGGLSPTAKLAELDEEIERGAVPIVVGDGMNDAPALGRAPVGVALADSADVAAVAADIVIADWPGRRELEAIPFLVELGRVTRRRIRFSLAWAFGYNAIGIPFAALGFLHPLLAAVLMLVSGIGTMAIAAGGRPLASGGESTGSARSPSADDRLADDTPASIGSPLSIPAGVGER